MLQKERGDKRVLPETEGGDKGILCKAAPRDEGTVRIHGRERTSEGRGTEAEEIQSHMDAELQKANTRYQKIYAEMETMTSVLEKNRRIFEETFAGIEKMREEMKRSALEVETFMKDPVKSIFPGEAKETAAEPDREDTAEEAEEEDEIVENSAVIDLENEPDYLDDDNDEEEDEIPNRAHDEEDEEE